MGDALSATWAIAVEDCERLVVSGGNLLAWITTDDRRLIAKWSVVPRLFQIELHHRITAVEKKLGWA
jgi:homoserine kinase type II